MQTVTSPPFPKIRCPVCNTGEIPPVSAARAQCPGCGTAFPVENGILKLLPEPLSRRSPAQILMEWEPLIQVYESRLWRKNPAFAHTLFGISFAEEFETVIDAAKLGKDEVVLDLACGPGIYSRPLARKLTNGSVTGLDISLPMLNHAADHARREKINNFLPVYENALNLPFPAAQFDAVICCGAFHLFPDHGRVLSEIGRVLKPRGRFAVAVFYRRLPGAPGKFFANIGKRLHGVHFFRPGEIKHIFSRAGLADVQFHHAKRAWMIVSGENKEKT